MDEKLYKSLEADFRENMALCSSAVESYLTELDGSGKEMSVSSLKEIYYTNAGSLISALEKAERSALEVSQQIIIADMQNDTLAVTEFEKLFTYYITLRKTVEEYLVSTEKLLSEEKTQFPTSSMRYCANIALHKIKII